MADLDARARPARFDPAAVERFRYLGYDLDPRRWTLTCRYALDDLEFEEVISIEPGEPSRPVDRAAADRAAGLVFLMAGVSYYKAAAPPLIELGDMATTEADRRLLEATYLHGLGEYAVRNDLDLSGVQITSTTPPVATFDQAARSPARPTGDAPLVPFGGGIDSIVTVEGLRAAGADLALFVVSRAGDRFEAIESAAAVTGLEVVRASRQLDPKILRSGELGYRNGHVPVTGILSSVAVLAALASGRDSVVMSNEWSASSGNLVVDGRSVNHQWSKSIEFEDLFRAAVASRLGPDVDYYSWLRPCSELWVAQRFSTLAGYHRAFRSCNRAFHIDPAARLGEWCGTCDKCCFIDLILAPYLSRHELAQIFGGTEPLEDEHLAGQFRALLGTADASKPFECVGDERECRVAAALAARRADRSANAMLAGLAAEAITGLDADLAQVEAALLAPLSRHHVPERYRADAALG